MIKYTYAMFPALQACKDGAIHGRAEIIERVANMLNLSEQDRLKRFESGEFRYKGEISWAISYISYAREIAPEKRLLVRAGRGKYQITDLGISLANDENAFDRWYKDVYGSECPKNKPNYGQQSEIVDNLIQEDIQGDDVKAQIRDMIDKIDSTFFESLVVQLLVKMGYGRGSVTQATRDGGIDGVINEDRLGISKIYVQAKHYGATKVGSPDIDKFAGAMKRMHQEKGVFITSSDFSEDAKRHANDLNIALIDGKSLINLMMEYEVGVKIEMVKTFVIDEDFWSEN